MPDFPLDVDLLIRLVEDHRLLWDKNLDEYKNPKFTTAAWREVCSALIDNFEQMDDDDKIEIGKLVKKKWANLRDAWLKYLKKQREVKRTKKYVYHDQMHFLTAIYCDPSETFAEEFTQQYEFSEEAVDLESDASADMYSNTFQTAKKCKIETTEETAAEIPEAQQQPSEDNNRHMLFFRGILPSVVGFSEDQTIDFQMGVLNVIKNIKSTKYLSTASSSATDK